MAIVEIEHQTRVKTLLPKPFEHRPLVGEPTVERVIFIEDCAYHKFGWADAYLGLHYPGEVYLSFDTDIKVKVKDKSGTKTEDPKKTKYGHVSVKRYLRPENPEVSVTNPKSGERITFSLDEDARVYLREQVAS